MASEKSVMAVIRASRPSFRNNADKVAFAVHSSFLAAGFVLTTAGEPAFAKDALSSSSTDEVGIEHWDHFEDEYAFVYLNTEEYNNKFSGVGFGLGIPGLQLIFGVSVGCGIGMSFGYGVGKGVAYDENRKYSNIGRMSHGL